MADIDATAAFFGAAPSAPAPQSATAAPAAAAAPNTPSIDETAAFFGGGASAPAGGNHFDRAVGFTLGQEGESLVANDAGRGPSKFGINKAANPDVDVQNLTSDRAKDLYRTRYWNAIGGDDLARRNPHLATAAFDTAVNMGVPTARQMLAASGGDPNKLLQLREAKYAELVAANPQKYGQYKDTWASRVGALRQFGDAEAPAGQDVTASPRRSYQNPFATQPAGDRTWGEAATDTGLGIASGLAGLVKSGAELAGLSTGNMDNVVSRVSDAVQNYLQTQQSQQLQDKRGARDQSVKEADGVLEKAWTAFSQTVSDPALLSDVVASNLSTMIPAAAAGRAAAVYSGGRAMIAAMEAGPVSLAARQAIARSAAEVGVWSAKGAAAVQQGADVAQQAYDDALKKPDAVWQQNPEYVARVRAGEDANAVKHALALSSARATFTPAMAISVAANSLPGTESIERALVGGVAKETVKAGTKMALPKAMAKSGLAETTSELLEEGGGQFAANVANQAYVDPNQNLGENVGEQGGMGAAGGFGTGVAAGAMHRQPHAQPVVPKAVADKAAEPNSPLSRATKAAIESPAGQMTAAAMQQADAAAQQANAPVDTSKRLAELDAIAAGTDKVAPRFFTPDEKKEYAQLKAAKEGTPGQKADDPLAERVQTVAAQLRAPGTMDLFRTEGSDYKPAKLVADLATAQSPSAPASAREQALGRLEFALEWAGAPKVEPTGTALDTQESAPTRLEQQHEREQQVQQQVDQPPERPPVANVIAALKIAGPMRSAEQSAIVTQARSRYTPAEMALIEKATTYAAGLSSEERIQLQQLQGRTGQDNVPQQSAPAAAPAQESGEQYVPTQPEQREQVAAPVVAQNPAAVSGNAGSVSQANRNVPAVHRKRRATLRQLVDIGMNLVERRGNEFFLTDGKREFKLENAGDAQLARHEIQNHLDEKTGRANGHGASNAQIDADNYRKGEPVKLYPKVVFIAEHGKGTERFDRKNNPPLWHQVMNHPYGDIEDTIGADGAKVDAFVVGDGNRIFVIDQIDPKTGKFDEHKVMLRARDEASARAAYLSNYEPGWQGLGAITEMEPEAFAAWVHDRKATKKPLGKLDGAARSNRDSVSKGGTGAGGARLVGGVAVGRLRSVSTDAWARDRVAKLFGGRSVPSSLVVTDGSRIFVKIEDELIELVDGPAAGSEIKSSSPRGENASPVDGDTSALIGLVAERMGQKPVWFRADGLGDGFTFSHMLPDVVFLNEKTTVDPLAVFGHEFWHNLKAISPGLHASVSAVVQARIKKGGNKAYRDYYHKFREGPNSDAALGETEIDEVVSDLGGNFMSEPAFWDEVMGQVQKDHPEQAKTMLAKLAALLERMIQNLMVAVRGEGYATDSLVDDLQKVRSAYREAVVKFLDGAGERKSAMQARVLREKQRMAVEGRIKPRPTEVTDVQQSTARSNPQWSERRKAAAWTDVNETEFGPEYERDGLQLLPLIEKDTSTDLAENSMPLGHAAHVEDGNKVYDFAIARDGVLAGSATLEVDPDGHIAAVHDIEITDQRAGTGRAVMEAVLASNPQGVRIIDIVPTAEPFWDKMGAGAQNVYSNATADWQSYQAASANTAGDGRGARGPAQAAQRNAATGDAAPEAQGQVGPDVQASPARQKLRPEVVKAAGPVLRFLTPSERAKLRVDTATRMYELFRDMPSANEMAAIAHAGRAKRGWYAESAKALVHVFGADAPRFAALLAAMSPQTSVETNLRNALATWKNWTRAGRPQDKGEIFQIMGRSVEGNKLTDSVLPAWVPNSVRALTAEDPHDVVLSGPKVNSFMLNLRGVASEVTNDAWMANYAAVDQVIFSGGLNVAGTDPGKGPGYLAMSARVRAAAARLEELTGEEWTPAEVQETIWSWAKTLYELQDKDMGARELLDNGAVTDDLISSTPDFRTQLHEERNEEPLRQAGYGEQLDSLAGRGDHAGPGEQGSAAGSKAGPFDPDTQGNHERRAASRLEQLRDDRLAAERARAVEVQQSPARDGRGREEGGSLAPLEGAPAVRGASGPDAGLVEVAHRYAAERGIDLRRQGEYAKADPERGARIAAAFEAMPHAPQDPKVKAAYKSLIEQTREQYDALVADGYRFTFFDSKSDPYDGNPWNAMRDLRANKRMAVYGTYDGYGTEGITQGAIDGNPMLVDTGLRWADQAGAEHMVTGNDLFRAVHDAFGHGLEGAGFRADGEENAWQAHVRLFTGPAVGAITSETRGQNSWLNFGPYGERNRTAKLEDTVFADQKTGLMPQWTWTEGRVADAAAPSVASAPQQSVASATQQPLGSQDLEARIDNMRLLLECLK